MTANVSPLTFATFITTYLDKICARKARKTFTTYRTIATTRLVPFFGAFSLDAIWSCDDEDFIVDTLKSGCTPAYTNNCVRTMKALLGHAVRRGLIAVSPLRDKIEFEDVVLPELELSDEERIAFLGAFDDEAAFRAYVAGRRASGHTVVSAHFAGPRTFGFGPNPASDATRYRYERFRALKHVFVVALETGLRKNDLLNLQWSQIDLAQGFIRVQMQKTKKVAVIPISALCRDALNECRRRSVVSRYVFITLDGKRVPEIAVRRAFARVTTRWHHASFPLPRPAAQRGEWVSECISAPSSDSANSRPQIDPHDRAVCTRERCRDRGSATRDGRAQRATQHRREGGPPNMPDHEPMVAATPSVRRIAVQRSRTRYRGTT